MADSGQTAPEPEPEPEPSYHTLFPFDAKPSSPPALPPPRPPSADSETGEPRRHVVEVEHPDDPPPALASPESSSTPSESPLASPSVAASPKTPVEPTEAGDSAPSAWQPWQRHTAPSYVMTLSACSRYAVLTDPICRVFWAPVSAASVWQKLEYTACQVAVSWDGERVWRLDESGAAYSLADPERGRPCGSHWVRAAREVIQLAADSAAVWYIKVRDGGGGKWWWY